MQAVFLIILLFGNIHTVRSDTQESKRVYVSNLPLDELFIGTDRDLKLDGNKLIAVNPTTTTDDNVVIPESIESAMEELSNMLPMWYKIAMLQSKDEFECMVVVNGNNFDAAVSSWVQINWNLDDDKSPMKKVLDSIDVIGPAWIKSEFIHECFCTYLKRKQSKLNGSKKK